MSLHDIVQKITEFRDDRDWAQFHSVRNLIAAINVEAGELQEAILWKTDREVEEMLGSGDREKILDEVADVLIYALLLTDDLGEKPLELIEKKLEKNKSKYPVRLSKGRSTKYTEFPKGER